MPMDQLVKLSDISGNIGALNVFCRGGFLVLWGHLVFGHFNIGKWIVWILATAAHAEPAHAHSDLNFELFFLKFELCKQKTAKPEPMLENSFFVILPTKKPEGCSSRSF